MKEFLQSYHPVSEKLLEEYVALWQPFSASKKSLLTMAGDTERYLYFVKEGIQKSYYSNDGRQHVMFFTYAPSFSGIVESFLTQTVSKYYFETITDSDFVRIGYDRHEEMLRKYHELDTLYRKITEAALAGLIEKQHELLAFSVEERFKVFVRRSAHLLNRVSQKDIASYLRIDQTNFSKLMNSGLI
ncbi:MAG: cyclic nucleotide-binding domain-containing protein [Bacteroidota bacterium]